MDRREIERRLNAMSEEDRTNLGRYFLKNLPETEDPEEAVQETLVRAFEHATELENDAAFWGWIWGIAQNVAREMRAAAEKREEESPLAGDAFEEEPTEPEGREKEAPEIAEQREEQATVREALTVLTEDERKVMELKIFAGLKQHEIVRALGWSAAKVKNALRSGYEKLREKLGDREE